MKDMVRRQAGGTLSATQNSETGVGTFPCWCGEKAEGGFSTFGLTRKAQLEDIFLEVGDQTPCVSCGVMSARSWT